MFSVWVASGIRDRRADRRDLFAGPDAGRQAHAVKWVAWLVLFFLDWFAGDGETWNRIYDLNDPVN